METKTFHSEEFARTFAKKVSSPKIFFNNLVGLYTVLYYKK